MSNPYSLEDKRCFHRITYKSHVQNFGDGIHKFYLEFRCPNKAIEGKPMCSSCIIQNRSKHQDSRHYPHGKIYEPIPSHSHMFGGSWYEEGVKKWGEPLQSCVTYAMRLQKEARVDLSKVETPILPKKMPRPRKNPNTPSTPSTVTSTAVATVAPVATTPTVSDTPVKELTISTDVPQVSDPPKVKRIRRPVAKKLSPMAPVPIESSTYPPSTSLPILTLFQPQQEQQEQQEEDEKKEEKPKRGRKKKDSTEEPKEPKEPKKRVAAKKKTASPYEKLVHSEPVVHKDACIPTHKEETMEEHDIQDYETEEVTLSIFILDGTVYFKDSAKNKLYRRIKEKTIGQYVGRYDPYTDSLVTDVPDSDDEE